MNDWEPDLYNRFRSYRAEPFHAILARLKIAGDETIVDLGCGSGENTVELARRAPHGAALGIDSSPAMIAKANAAKAALPADLAARLDFRLGDIGAIRLPDRYSLVFSNAALHWIDDHRRALAACHGILRQGGKLVVQMPANYEETAQVTLSALATEPPWRALLARVEVPSRKVGSPQSYTELLTQLGFVDIDCYYQVFVHPMNGPHEVVEWSRATVLRPFLEALPEDRRDSFVAQWRGRLEEAYGTRGAMRLNFRRIFLWARREAS
ncbi:MAG TPA: methyltransferase domain-containing protein [Candidatus Binataceae bacterium]|jgi:trans-aconitate 2-methyltransferase|nr:methyltransferase domain-containing protein [Candidatus Binataceae bacterium]